MAADEEDTEDTARPGLPFLRWMLGNMAFENDSGMKQLSDYVKRMLMITVGNTTALRYRRMNDRFFETLENTEKHRRHSN